MELGGDWLGKMGWNNIAAVYVPNILIQNIIIFFFRKFIGSGTLNVD